MLVMICSSAYSKIRIKQLLVLSNLPFHLSTSSGQNEVLYAVVFVPGGRLIFNMHGKQINAHQYIYLSTNSISLHF